MRRLLIVRILLVAWFAWRSTKLLLDRAILLADNKKNLHQHQLHHDHDEQQPQFLSSLLSSSSTMNGASEKSQQESSSSSSSASLTWFLHFHKAAGSSFTDLALKNNHIFRDADRDKHGHLELSLRQGEFRWELLGAADKEESVEVNNRTTCWLDHANKDEMEQEQTSILGQELLSLRQQGVSFVSTEHWFPSHKVLQQVWQHEQYQDQPAPTMVVLLRDPVERILSSYAFHNRGGGRCSGTIGTKKKKRCGLEDWHKGEANMYVSMLNGLPFGPRKVGTACAAHMLNVDEQEYQSARDSLDQHFQVVLTLDSIRQRPSQVACVLNKALGWNETTLPQKNRSNNNNQNMTNNGRRRRHADYSNIDSQVLHQVQDVNAYDIQLYQHAQDMERRLFAQFGCNNNDDTDSKYSIRQER